MPPEFFQTPMGRRFYEHTVPELVKQIERVAEALEAILDRLAKQEQEAKR
jgi:chaperonin cofactor prefoldin